MTTTSNLFLKSRAEKCATQIPAWLRTEADDDDEEDLVDAAMRRLVESENAQHHVTVLQDEDWTSTESETPVLTSFVAAC